MSECLSSIVDEIDDGTVRVEVTLTDVVMGATEQGPEWWLWGHLLLPVLHSPTKIPQEETVQLKPEYEPC